MLAWIIGVFILLKTLIDRLPAWFWFICLFVVLGWVISSEIRNTVREEIQKGMDDHIAEYHEEKDDHFADPPY